MYVDKIKCYISSKYLRGRTLLRRCMFCFVADVRLSGTGHWLSTAALLDCLQLLPSISLSARSDCVSEIAARYC
jgi:hypothetical protein